MTKDLGTYFVRCTLYDGRGWITKINTGYRFTEGSGNQSPIHAFAVPPNFKNEDDLIDNFVFSYKENNWSCDCNRGLDLARAYQQPEPESTGFCSGDAKIRIKKFEILGPALKVVYCEDHFEPPLETVPTSEAKK